MVKQEPRTRDGADARWRRIVMSLAIVDLVAAVARRAPSRGTAAIGWRLGDGVACGVLLRSWLPLWRSRCSPARSEVNRRRPKTPCLWCCLRHHRRRCCATGCRCGRLGLRTGGSRAPIATAAAILSPSLSIAVRDAQHHGQGAARWRRPRGAPATVSAAARSADSSSVMPAVARCAVLSSVMPQRAPSPKRRQIAAAFYLGVVARRFAVILVMRLERQRAFPAAPRRRPTVARD